MNIIDELVKILSFLFPKELVNIPRVEIAWLRRRDGTITGELRVKNISSQRIIRFRILREIINSTFKNYDTYTGERKERKLVHLSEEKFTLEPNQEFIFQPVNTEFGSCVFGMTNNGVEFLADTGFWYRYILTEDKTGTKSFEKEKITILYLKTLRMWTISNYRFWIVAIILFVLVILGI
jgi:hypothetical protein